MQWMNGWRLAPLALALHLLAAPSATPAADMPASTAATSAAYASDLRAYLDSVRWYERLLAAVPRPTEPYEREVATGFIASLTPDQFYARAMPVFARHIPPKEAETLGAMARKKPVPLGKQQAALQSFWQMEKTVGPEMAPVWRDLVTAYSQRMLERMYAEIRRGITDLAEHRGTGYKVTVNRVGLPSLDRVAWLVVRNNVAQTNASQVMEGHCKGGAMAVAFLPSTLMASNGLNVARQAVDDCEQALETMEKSNEAAYNELRDGLRALNLPEKYGLAQQMDKNSRKYYEFNMKLGEMNREMLQKHRGVINLVEARREHIHLKDDRMLFDSPDDLAEMNRIVAEVGALGQAINDFIYQTRQGGVLRDVDLHDGVKAPVAAAKE